MGKKVQVPFDENGDQLFDLGYWARKGIKEGTFKGSLRDNLPFNDTLYYQAYHKDGGSAMFRFKRKDTRTMVYFHAQELDNIILSLNNGIIHGRFDWICRGGKWSLRKLENQP